MTTPKKRYKHTTQGERKNILRLYDEGRLVLIRVEGGLVTSVGAPNQDTMAIVCDIDNDKYDAASHEQARLDEILRFIKDSRAPIQWVY